MLQNLNQIRCSGFENWFAGDEDDIVAGFQVCQQGLHRGAHHSLGPVSLDGIANRFSRSYPDPDLVQVIRQE